MLNSGGQNRANKGVTIPSEIIEQTKSHLGSIVEPDQEEVAQITYEWKFTLVGRLLGRKIPFFIFATEAKKRWGYKLGFRIVRWSKDAF
ncbi:hypothetical protein AXF42_Ash012537 [Apostasia shenzhenica]|uniref:Uncharacterized protein n=1 Tax=Apostasia shenzhenica TaxID=1088818 RepID=A0A2I0AR35_9ASPA|nr:hypothetical protein AXF42_Ash012537 [Apostasia shenzhenica]